MHISITGDLGSGKSTVAKLLSKELDYNFISTGVIQRKMGLARGRNTLEFNKFTDNNKEIDDYIDQHLKDIDAGEELYILDSRLAWFFVKSSFKVYLMAFDEIAAKRILKDKDRIGEPETNDVLKKISDSKERRKSENDRFERNYGAKFDVYESFDLVVDTSFATIDQVRELILTQYKKWKAKEDYHAIWLSAPRLIPTKRVAAMNGGSPEGINGSNSVKTVRVGEWFYVVEGHEDLSASILDKTAFVPISNLATGDEEFGAGLTGTGFVQDSFDKSLVNDWESYHSFEYFTYPQLMRMQEG